MTIVRLILLLAILGGLTLLLVQNWSPALPLVFLGGRTQPLPLALWILFSTTAGAITTVLMTTLFNLSTYFSGQQRQIPLRPPVTPPRRNQTPREEPRPRPSNPPPTDSTREPQPNDSDDDWETGSSLYDDWEVSPQREETSTPNPKNTQVRDSSTSESKKSSNSDSVYSYNYRELKNSGAGKAESIYDADYRVIIPPYEPSTTRPAEEEEWEFLDEDDFEDEQKRPSR